MGFCQAARTQILDLSLFWFPGTVPVFLGTYLNVSVFLRTMGGVNWHDASCYRHETMPHINRDTG